MSNILRKALCETIKLNVIHCHIYRPLAIQHRKYSPSKNSKPDNLMVNRKVLEARHKLFAEGNRLIPSYPDRNPDSQRKESLSYTPPVRAVAKTHRQDASRPVSKPDQCDDPCRPDPCNPCRKPCPPPPPASNMKWILLLVAGAAGGLAYYLYRKSQGEESGGGPPERKTIRLATKVPASSQDIPKEIPYLLIGGGTASFSAFRAIKSNVPKAKVMVISSETEMPYMRPPLSKELWLTSDLNTKESLKFKQWNGVERSLYYEPDDFYTDPTKLLDEPNGGVAVIKGYTVKHVDVCNRTAVLCDGTEIKYGECLLATGSIPKNLNIFHSAPLKVKEKISLFKTISDFEDLKSIIDSKKSIAIIGGGFLGSELACSMAKYGECKNLKVYQVFHEAGNMGKILPEYLSEWTTNRVREEGVIVIPKVQVQGVEMVDNQLKLALNNGESVLVDHVVVAIGSEPNIQLALESGLEVDKKYGGYVVNAELEARRHLYVAGDAACFYDPKLGRRRVEHHDHAVVSGRLAGENMVGLKKPYKHQSMFWSDLGPKVGYEAIGLVDACLPTVGVFAKATDKDTPAGSGRSNLVMNEEETKSIPSVTESSSSKEEETKNENDKKECKPIENAENYGKGVIFYLRDNIIVGIVLWNVFNRINIARVIISEGKKYDDLNEVAKLFDIHS